MFSSSSASSIGSWATTSSACISSSDSTAFALPFPFFPLAPFPFAAALPFPLDRSTMALASDSPSVGASTTVVCAPSPRVDASSFGGDERGGEGGGGGLGPLAAEDIFFLIGDFVFAGDFFLVGDIFFLLTVAAAEDVEFDFDGKGGRTGSGGASIWISSSVVSPPPPPYPLFSPPLSPTTFSRGECRRSPSSSSSTSDQTLCPPPRVFLVLFLFDPSFHSELASRPTSSSSSSSECSTARLLPFPLSLEECACSAGGGDDPCVKRGD